MAAEARVVVQSIFLVRWLGMFPVPLAAVEAMEVTRVSSIVQYPEPSILQSRTLLPLSFTALEVVEVKAV